MNPIMQPIINKYVVLYVAHPFGGDLDNVSRAEIHLSKLRKLLPRHTLVSPIHNWGYLNYELTGQVEAISNCVSLLLRCDALVLAGRRAMGFELKESYFKQAVLNCQKEENHDDSNI